MTAIDQLVSFAAFALALAGFATVALVLGRREGARPSGSAYVVQFMVINAMGSALLAAVLSGWAARPPGFVRATSVVARAFGAFLIYAAV